MDQTKYKIETRDHESIDLEIVILLSKVCVFCEEERHVIMDYPFVPFHTRAGITKDVELQNVVGALMDQPQEHELKILVI